MERGDRKPKLLYNGGKSRSRREGCHYLSSITGKAHVQALLRKRQSHQLWGALLDSSECAAGPSGCRLMLCGGDQLELGILSSNYLHTEQQL